MVLQLMLQSNVTLIVFVWQFPVKILIKNNSKLKFSQTSSNVVNANLSSGTSSSENSNAISTPSNP